jgi:hypothetical protein
MDADRLFNVSKERETAVDRLWDLIAKLDGANSTALSYKTVVKGNDADGTMTEHKKESTRMKARYFAQFYRISLDSMPYKTWNDCCQEAINRLAAVHICHVKMQEFWRDGMLSFVKGKYFVTRTKAKRDLPAFLEAHPIVVTMMKEYGHENVLELSLEMMHTYLHNTIIKSLIMERLEGKETINRTREYKKAKLQLFKEYGLNCLCRITTYCWMLLLGFR